MRYREAEDLEAVAIDPGLAETLPREFLRDLRKKTKTYLLNDVFFKNFKPLSDHLNGMDDGFEKTFVQKVKTFHEQSRKELVKLARRQKLSPKLIRYQARLIRRHIRLIMLAVPKANKKRTGILKKLFG